MTARGPRRCQVRHLAAGRGWRRLRGGGCRSLAAEPGDHGESPCSWWRIAAGRRVRVLIPEHRRVGQGELPSAARTLTLRDHEPGRNTGPEHRAPNAGFTPEKLAALWSRMLASDAAACTRLPMWL